MSRALRLASAFAAVATLALTVTTALAHSRPVLFDPAPGAVLDAAPASVQGWFTSDLRRDPNWSFLHVADSQGNRVDSGETSLSSDRRSMSVALKPGVGPGAYTVTWRTYDDTDGAVFGDCFTFFVGKAAADAAVAAGTRLDAGGKCARIDVESKAGTPTAAQLTPSASAGTANTEGAGPAASGGSGKVHWWLLIPGIAGGLAVGILGGFLMNRKSGA